MKNFLLTSILFMGFVSYFYGQDTFKIRKLKTKKHTETIEKSNAIIFAPLNLFDFVNPNIQIGYERFVSKKWAIQIEGGIIINHSIENYVIDWLQRIKECPYTNKGFRVKGSVKYMVLTKRKIKLYVSPELFYARNKSGMVADFLVSYPDFEYPTNRPEEANAYSQFFYNDEEKIGINLKAGIKLLVGKYFFMEPHIGVGVAFRNVVQTGRENPNDELDSIFGIFNNAAPNKVVPTLPFNLKFGIRF